MTNPIPTPDGKTHQEIDKQIALALCRVVKRLTDDPDILSVIGSYGDTLDDREILSLLYGWLEDGRTLHATN